MLKRTRFCGELRPTHVGEAVVLCGWVNTFREQSKGLAFVDLRDKEGLAQLVFDSEHASESVVRLGRSARREDVIGIRGMVRLRTGGPNPKLATGEVEIVVDEIEIFNRAENPPILPDDYEAEKIAEETRLRYRYIDLRRPRMQYILRTRSRITKAVRDYFQTKGFLEIETPLLIKSTPEGARDFVVPSRMYPGTWYALPQSPQLFKQVLMVAGCDRYMQICRCLRDEDPRADRQAEFSQIDLEMSFVEREDVIAMMSGFVQHLWSEVLHHKVEEIPQMTWLHAMERYGIDRPDTRFDLLVHDVSDIAAKCDFKVFQEALAKKSPSGRNGVVKCIVVPGGADKLTRKMTDGYSEWVRTFRAGGVPVVKRTENGWETGIAKFIEPICAELETRCGIKPGDTVLFATDTWEIATKVMGELRLRVARDLKLIPEGRWNFLWVVDFPMFEWDADGNRWVALHHPFTSPNPDQFEELNRAPGECLSAGYDLVLNGSEIAGGSIRIHQMSVQEKVFSLIGLTKDEADAKFGFLLNALRHGAPPHGGVAFGLDRLVMHIVGTDNIRDVIAFPKTQSGQDLMIDAPSMIDESQLQELQVRSVATSK
ncbi:MAG: aspartate--tRNA ligase [Planctomycetota bacterium]|nr:aspartate--tRNA ligase [Planctomycetota bacterium]